MKRADRSDNAEAVRALLVHADPAELPRISAGIDKASRACGCATAAAAMLAAAAAAIVWWVIRRSAAPFSWPEVLVAVSLVAAAAAIGKLMGLAAADLWLWATRRRLEAMAGSIRSVPGENNDALHRG